ncbi:uncharacterized protein LOC126574508 [Anopheles aquasalis]|uniref:uncharacterized protein LOC126574508 n=1 Tax=Anopheles aquasalis TaxID=42839 RepID=UPI00215A4A35|nr:uncharacterized protein LOC126574508 [Anopheles aquasalis]
MYHSSILSLLTALTTSAIDVSKAQGATRHHAFQVAVIPFATVDAASYCRTLQAKLLRTPESPVFLLDTSNPAYVYQILPSRTMDHVDNAAFKDGDDIAPSVNDLPTEELIRMIENKEVTIKSHRIVDTITLITAGGDELRLTLERSGDLEPVGIMPRAGYRGGLSGQDKLLLSLLGGGGGGSKVRGIERLKN